MVQVDQEVRGEEGSKMEIDVKKKDDNELVFIVEGVDVPFVNALRRICMMEIPKASIEDVDIIRNDSTLFDEVLAHRLGLIPITSSTASKSLIFSSECDCGDHCPKCSASFVLKEKGPKVVYSKDLKPEDPDIKPVYDTVPILRLKKDEVVELAAIAQLGIGLEHAKWEPTTACAYKYYPKITIDDNCDACGKCAEECPRGVLEVVEGKEKVTVVDNENCSMCGTCMRTCPTGAIDVGAEEGKFIFRIESDGSLSPEEILMKACDVLSEKSEKITEFCA
ncbi:MAG: DNA-directed RNA polymerase subunit D [Methanomicrobiales archaeon]